LKRPVFSTQRVDCCTITIPIYVSEMIFSTSLKIENKCFY
jgi:hypothetical protein